MSGIDHLNWLNLSSLRKESSLRFIDLRQNMDGSKQESSRWKERSILFIMKDGRQFMMR